MMLKKYLSRYKDDFDNIKKDSKSIKTWHKLIPNLLTIIRPVGMIPANILFFSGHVVPAICLTGALLATDFFDGKLARKWNCQSKLGADLDTIGDKIIYFGLALPLIVSNPLLLLNIALEMGISFVNVLGRLNDIETKTVYLGKVKTWFTSITLVLGYLVSFFSLPVAMLNALIFVTFGCEAAALTEYIIEYKKMSKAKEEATVKTKENVVVENYTLEKENNLIDELKKEREFLLSTTYPNKVYTGKKRVRELMKKKRIY